MKEKPIDRWSFRYTSFKFYCSLCHRIFYRDLQVKFRERIPKGAPVIFAPNHQNALMDALGVLFTSHRDLVFVARADIFSNTFLARILYLFKMYPIYRIRDGVGEMSKNEEIFQKAIDVLDRGKCPFCIMPEGNHGDKRRLRPLVKGIFRIAFRAQEKFEDREGVQIVPVGIDYSNYSNFRSKVLLIYGHPVSVGKYFHHYREEPAKGINILRDVLSDEMRQYMIDIKTETYYNTYYALRAIFNRNMRNLSGIRHSDLYSRFVADKQMISMLDRCLEQQPERIAALDRTVSEYTAGIDRLKIRDWVFARKGISFAGLVLLSLVILIALPVFIYGWINNIIPWKIPLQVTGRMKDRQFHSSVKLVVGVFLFPLIYLIQSGIVALLAGSWPVTLIYLVSLPLTGWLAHMYYIGWKKIRALWKYKTLSWHSGSEIPQLGILRNEIIEVMTGISNDHLAAVKSNQTFQ
jgi:1-acyl-sn-glycerol-3-phosphate acyltransferase